MNNPIAQILGVARSGGNPMALIEQLAQGNPQFAQYRQMTQGKNPQQLEQMVRNMCRERGTTPENILQQIGIPSPFGGMR